MKAMKQKQQLNSKIQLKAAFVTFSEAVDSVFNIHNLGS